MRPIAYATRVEPKLGIIARAAGFLLRCAAYPIVWTARTISNNFLASSTLVASMGLVYLGSRNNDRVKRLYCYLTAAALLSTHCFIVGFTCGAVIPLPGMD